MPNVNCFGKLIDWCVCVAFALCSLFTVHNNNNFDESIPKFSHSSCNKLTIGYAIMANGAWMKIHLTIFTLFLIIFPLIRYSVILFRWWMLIELFGVCWVLAGKRGWNSQLWRNYYYSLTLIWVGDENSSIQTANSFRRTISDRFRWKLFFLINFWSGNFWIRSD